jgi:hypothetical protein
MTTEEQLSLEDTSAWFPIDSQLMMVLPRAGASLKNPDVELPVLRGDSDGYFLEMKVRGDDREVAVTRRLPLEDLTTEEWQELKEQYETLDLERARQAGLNQLLDKIPDRKVQRIFLALMTFLNPRQVAIVLHLYREAAKQGNKSVVTFRSNDLLESLGYTRTKDGGFPSKLRSQLNQDLVALHRTELIFARSTQKGQNIGAQVVIKNVVRIKSFEIDNVPRNFDLIKAADYTYELADSYTVNLEFFDGPSKTGDYLLLPTNLDIQQAHGSNAKHDYRMRLLMYLGHRLRWDTLQDGEYLTVSKNYLFKNLELFGSNKSRNNQIFWRTVEELQEDGYILSAQELPGKKKVSKVQFRLNPDKIRVNTTQ